MGRNKTKTNAKGVTTIYEYDDADNLLNTKVKKSPASPEITTGTATYDLIGNQTTKTDGNGNTAINEYNYFDKIRETILSGDDTIPSNTIAYQYDSVSNLIKKADSTGTVNIYTYDNQDRILTSTEKRADGTQAVTVSKRYDKNGNTAKEIDGNGNITVKTYDELNRLKTVTDAVYHTTTYTYDQNGNQLTVTDWRGNTCTNTYDPLNRLIRRADPYRTIQKLEYYENGLQSKTYDALNNLTQYTYDKNNRLLCTTDPEGHTKINTYDEVGNMKTKADGENRITTFIYDQFNRLTDVINAKQETTTYTYDLNGNMLTQKDGKGNISYYEYNAANKLKKRIDAGGKLSGNSSVQAKTESYTYDADGNMLTKTDRNGRTTNYAYDVHGRLISELVENVSIDYTYDNNGNLLSITDGTGTTERTYDALNRTITKTIPDIGTTNFSYDITDGMEAGNYAESTTDPKGNTVKKVYDKAGRLKSVIADGKITAYEYYADGSRKKITYSSGTAEEYTYYADNLLKTLTNKKADGTTIETYGYTYDKAHNQLTKTDAKGQTSHTYDDLNRLKTVTEPTGKVTSYAFDAAGNRTGQAETQSGKTTTTNYAYNEQNRLIKSVTETPDGATQIVSCTYDNNGNLLRNMKSSIKEQNPLAEPTISVEVAGEAVQESSNDVEIYEYNELNQLVKSAVGDKTVTNTYNGEGIRVAKEVNGEKTRYLYEGNDVILELDGAGNEKAHNVQGTSLLSRTAGGQTADYLYNGHGDVTLLLDANGEQLASYYYDAFGNPTSVQESVYNPYRYAGYMWDEETGKYYLMARMYDPETARFLQEDTHRGDKNDPLSLNLYTYCHNEPLMYTDPDGHEEGNLRDFANKAHATITYNDKTKTATVSLNGVTKSYSLSQSKVVDGRIRVDSNDFNKTFKIGSSSSNNKSYMSTLSKATTISASKKPDIGKTLTSTGVGIYDWAKDLAIAAYDNNPTNTAKLPKGMLKDCIDKLEPKAFQQARPFSKDDGLIEKFEQFKQGDLATKAYYIANVLPDILLMFSGGAEVRAGMNAERIATTESKVGLTLEKTLAEGAASSIFKNGKVTVKALESNSAAFSGKSANEIAQMLRNEGYDVTVEVSTKSRSGAEILKINNPGNGKNISQVQVSPGGGRHGANSYVKISTTDQGTIKIVDGAESAYKTDGTETAKIIFTGGK